MHPCNTQTKDGNIDGEKQAKSCSGRRYNIFGLVECTHLDVSLARKSNLSANCLILRTTAQEWVKIAYHAEPRSGRHIGKSTSLPNNPV